MDRKEKAPPVVEATKPYAEEPEISDSDEPILETPLGREDDHAVIGRGTLYADEVASLNPGGQPRSEITGNPEPGTDADRYEGLNDLEEEVRQFTEDTAVGENEGDLPVFERPLTPART
ncbi:MAG TPA: hypothetical protein VGD36_05470 [Xanthobacteraceae bacterium]